MKLEIIISLAVTLSWAAYGYSRLAPQGISKDESEALKKIYENELVDYHSFALMPGTSEKMDKLNGARAGYVTVYVNEIARKAIAENADVIPDGGLIIKDIYNREKTHHGAALMKKINGDWYFGGFYPLYEPYKFGKDASSSAKSCVECHASAKRDKVYLWK